MYDNLLKQLQTIALRVHQGITSRRAADQQITALIPDTQMNDAVLALVEALIAKDVEIDRLNRTVRAKEEDAKAMRAQAAEDKANTATKLNEMANQHETATAQLQHELAKASQHCKTIESQLFTLHQSHNSLQMQYDTAVSDYKSKLAAAEATLTQRSQVTAGMQKEIAEQRLALQVAKADADRLCQKEAALHEDLRKVQAECQALKQEKSEHLARIEELSAASVDLARQAQQATLDLQAAKRSASQALLAQERDKQELTTALQQLQKKALDVSHVLALPPLASNQQAQAARQLLD